MRYEDILTDVSERSGLPRSDPRIESMLLALAESLAGLVDASLGVRIAAELPPPLADAAHRATRWAAKPYRPKADDLYRRTGARLRLPIGTALEHAQVVCPVLAATLSAETRALLHAAFGESAEQLFSPPAHGAPVVARPRHGRTIADGRLGSAHPLSEAGLTRSHRHSVANPNPHAASKMSSGAKADDIADGRGARG